MVPRAGLFRLVLGGVAALERELGSSSIASTHRPAVHRKIRFVPVHEKYIYYFIFFLKKNCPSLSLIPVVVGGAQIDPYKAHLLGYDEKWVLVADRG